MTTDRIVHEREKAPINCAYWVEGHGEPLFLVHGIGSSHATWNEIVNELSKDFTCVSYDLRGHGISPLPDTPFGLGDLVDDLEALRKKLGFKKIHIAGHSLGGMIGPAYARKFPDQVLTLGLLSTAAGRTEDDSKKVNGVVKAMEDNGIGNTLATLVDRWFTDSFAKTNPNIIKQRLAQITNMDAEVFLNVFRIYANTEMAPWLHEISTPSLVLTGELDGGCNPRLNQFIHDELKDSDLVILNGLKHSILTEDPGKVACEIQKFIKSKS